MRTASLYFEIQSDDLTEEHMDWILKTVLDTVGYLSLNCSGGYELAAEPGKEGHCDERLN